MMSRVRILCEDRLSERFLRRLCEQRGIQVIDTQVAPSGRGSAAQWVAQRYPEAVKKRRSKNFQESLGLLVHIDGDAHGVVARKSALDARLVAYGLPVRGHSEPVAVFVPTWSIETWLLHLSGLGQPAESEQIKQGQLVSAQRRAAMETLEHSDPKLSRAAAAWSKLPSPVPSLADSRAEGRRVGLL